MSSDPVDLRRERDSKSEGTHVAVIDGLRAAAILLVVLFHVYEKSGFAFSLKPIGIPFEYAALPQAGFLGVQIFLFVSGFCIFYPYARFLSHAQPLQTVKEFGSRRFWKIVPSYFVALTFMAFVFPFDRQPGGIDVRLDYVLHLFFMHSFNPVSYISINGTFWSLAVEVQFYALFALSLPVLLRWPVTTIVAVGCVGVLFRVWLALQGLTGVFAWEFSLPS